MILLAILLVALGVFSTLGVYRNLEVLRYKLVPPAPEEEPEHGELVSVVIPARNEETNIGDCVRSVLAQTYCPIQIVVINDNSTDATGQILEELAAEHCELEVVNGKSLPPGWVGKNFAVYQGVAGAKGHWLVFLDADTRLSPDALVSAVALAKSKGLDMFSLWPRHVLVSFWERVIQPVVLGIILSGAPPSLTEDPKDPTTGVFGQFIFFKRAAYEEVGGHEAVKGEVLEDWRIAERIKAKGLRVALAEGQEMARVRMYTSLSGLWEGWSKNTFLGTGRRLDILVVLLVFVFAIGVWPIVLLAWAILAAASDQSVAILAGAAAAFQFGLMYYYAIRLNQRMGIRVSSAVWYPLGSALFVGILVNSAYRVMSGRGVTWKGRSYTQGP